MESGSNVHDAGPSCSYQASTRIFLSHSGVQKGFVERLHRRLSIVYTSDCVFFDTNMKKGVYFNKEIFQAIEQCELAIVVMSPDYFRNKWPMVELAKIVEAQKSQKQPEMSPKKPLIVPLYYKLTVKAFRKVEERNEWREAWKEIIEEEKSHHFNDKTLECWEEALETLSPTLNGCEFLGKSEEEYIENIVKEACKLVAPSPPYTCVQDSKRLEAALKEVRVSTGLWTCHGLLSLARFWLENLHVSFKLYRPFC